MAIELGKVLMVEGIVYAENLLNGVLRLLTIGSTVFANEVVKPQSHSDVAIRLNNGDIVALGENTTSALSEFYETDIGEQLQLEEVVDSGDISTLNLDSLDEPGAGIELESSIADGVVIDRLALEGKVTNSGVTAGLLSDVSGGAERVDFFAPTATVNTAPEVFTVDLGGNLLGLVGANRLDFGGDALVRTAANSPIELGVLDVVNYQPDIRFAVFDRDNNISSIELKLDNGVGEDVLGISRLIGEHSFAVKDKQPGLRYDISKGGKKLIISSLDGSVISTSAANTALAGISIVDSSLLGSLLNIGLVIGASYSIKVTDSDGLTDYASSKQFLDLSVLHNNTSGGISDLLDVPLLGILAPVTGMLDEALGNIDNILLGTVISTLGVVDELVDPLDPVLEPVGELLNNVGDLLLHITDTLSRHLSSNADEQVTDFLADVFENLGSTLNSLLFSSDGILNQLGEGLESTVVGLDSLLENVGNHLGSGLVDVGHGLGDTLQFVGNGLEDLLAPVGESVVPLLDPLLIDPIGDLVVNLGDTVEDILDLLGGGVSDLGSGVANLSEPLTPVLEPVGNLLVEVGDGLDDLGGTLSRVLSI